MYSEQFTQNYSNSGYFGYFGSGVMNLGRGCEVFLYTIAFRPYLEPTHLPIQWIKQPWGEAGHSSLSSVKFKNACSCTSSTHYPFI